MTVQHVRLPAIEASPLQWPPPAGSEATVIGVNRPEIASSPMATPGLVTMPRVVTSLPPPPPVTLTGEAQDSLLRAVDSLVRRHLDETAQKDAAARDARRWRPNPLLSFRTPELIGPTLWLGLGAALTTALIPLNALFQRSMQQLRQELPEVAVNTSLHRQALAQARALRARGLGLPTLLAAGMATVGLASTAAQLFGVFRYFTNSTPLPVTPKERFDAASFKLLGALSLYLMRTPLWLRPVIAPLIATALVDAFNGSITPPQRLITPARPTFDREATSDIALATAPEIA